MQREITEMLVTLQRITCHDVEGTNANQKQREIGHLVLGILLLLESFKNVSMVTSLLQFYASC